MTDFQGLIIDVASDFNSIPGLEIYLDSRFGKTIEGGNVSEWASQTARGDIFFKNPSASLPLDTDGTVDFDDIANTDQKALSGIPDPNFNFFHDGSPFGLFLLSGFEQGSGSNRLFTTRAGSGSGANLLYSTGNRLIYQIFEAGSLVKGTFLGGTGILTEDQFEEISVTRNSLDDTDNLKTYINNSLVNEQSWTATDVTADDGNALTIGNIDNNRVLYGIKLLYNWTGFTAAEVEDFASQVRDLLTEAKQNFTYPTP